MKRSIVTVCIFSAMLLGLAILNLTTPIKAFSENENRYLKQLPDFSWEGLFAGKYTPALDDFVIDQFAYRDTWVGVKTMSERILLRNSSGGAYFARDGSVIEMFDNVDRERFSRNLTFVSGLADIVRESNGVRTTVMLVPTQSMIRSHMLPPFAPEADQRGMLDEAASTLAGSAVFIDVSDRLLSHRDEYIFYKTDHHWTSLGAYYSYNSMRSQLGRREKSIDNFRLELLTTEFYGTTWSKASLYSVPPDTIIAYISRDVAEIGALHIEYGDGESFSNSFYECSFLDTKDKFSVFLNGNHSVTRITTGKENGRRLLVVKDSFANNFTQFLISDYEEVILLDPRYFRESYAQFAVDNDITDMLVLYSLKGFASDANLFYLTA